MQPEVTATNLLATFVGVVVVYLPAKWWLDRYYASRFGRTVNSRLRRSRIWMVPAFVALVISDQVFGMGPVGGGFLIVAAESLWIAMRDWPARGHYLVGCVAAALAVAVQFSPDPTPFGKPEALGVAIIGLSYIPVGLLDHRLLRSVMRNPAAETGLTPSEERTAGSE